MKTGVLFAAALSLFACTSTVQPVPSASRQSTDTLRNCATVTAYCSSVTAIHSRIPELCSETEFGVVCLGVAQTSNYGTSARTKSLFYRETLAAMDTQAGVCALSAIHSGDTAFGPGEFAILGIWSTLNNVQQYRQARYLPTPNAVSALETPQSFGAACQKLSSSIV